MSQPAPNSNPFGEDEEQRLVSQSVINYMDPHDEAPAPNASPFGYQQAVPVINSDPITNYARYKGWTLIAIVSFIIIAFLILILTLFVKLIEFMGIYTLVALLVLIGLLFSLIWWRRNNPPDTGYNPI